MEVYIDKNFVLNYWAVSKHESSYIHFENEFLKHPNLYTIITNFSSYDEVLESEEAALFFNDIVQESRVAEFVYLPELTDSECLESCLNNGGFKMFLMEFETAKCQQLEEQYGYRFISSTQIEDKWSKFERNKIIEKTLALPVDDKDEDVFNSWDDLKGLSTFPNNSIVISDKYILSDKSHSHLKDNILPLLEAIIPQYYKGILSVTILSEEILSQKKGQSLKDNAVAVHQLLNRIFAKHKQLKIKFSIVGFDKYFISGDQPNIHDRHIYTNYFTIKSGIGFNLFNNDNRKVEDSEVTITFNFQRFSMKTIPVKINGLKAYLNKMKKSDKLGCFKYYPENFTNNLLN
jgi:hypothetical protein